MNEKKTNKTFEYYDWQRTLSYDAEITMVLTARGRGKTFGIRKQAVKDALEKDFTFVEVCRFANEVSGVMNGYFDKLQQAGFFTEWYFRTQGSEAFATRDAPATEDGKKQKRRWKRIGYFVALSNQQALKKHTFINVRRIIFDEVILDAEDRYHRYLPHEFDTLANLVDTVTRQRPGEETLARVYLLGNSIDLINPYFRRFGVTKPPSPGYHWYNNKHFLLHFEENNTWGEARRETTLVGHMLSNHEASRALFNSFATDDQWIASKTSDAHFAFGIIYLGQSYGIWGDYKTDILYVNSKIPKNSNMVFTLTLSDQTVDYYVLDKSSRRMQSVANLARAGQLRYEDAGTMEGFKQILSCYGLTV